MKTWGIILSTVFSLSLSAQAVIVTNTNDAGAGSLRQAIVDANANWSIDTIKFNIPTTDAGYNSGTGVFTINITSSELPAISNRVMVVDGSSQTAFTGNTNTTIFGIGGTVGTDAIALAQVDGPEIEIVDASSAGTLKWGIMATERDFIIHDVAIHSFGNDWFIWDNANLAARGNAHNFEAYNCVLGSEAHAAQAPTNGVNGGPNFQALSVDNGKFHHNFVAYGETMGGFLRTGCTDWDIYQNDFAFNALDDAICDGLDVADFCEDNIIRENIFRNNGGNGFDSYNGTGAYLVENNTSVNNGLKNVETNGMRIYGAYGDTIRKNIIKDNVGAGILVTSGAKKHFITENSMFNNGNVLPSAVPAVVNVKNQIAIDLLASNENHKVGSAPYITTNDNNDNDAGGNELQNFPVIDAAYFNNGNLVVKGFAPAGALVEFFTADLYSGAVMPQGKTFLFSATEGSANDADASTGSYGPGLINGIDHGQGNNVNRFEFSVPAPAGIVSGDDLTATAYVVSQGTSEFCGAYTTYTQNSVAGVNPELNCIYIDVNGDIVARFGYNNTNNTTISELVGANNQFVPTPADRGQNTSFAPGTHTGEFEVTFPASGTLTWNLQGNSVTADINTVRCPADLRVQQSVSNNTPNSGDQVTFTITIDNLTCGTPATAVEIAYLMDANFTYVSHNTPSSGSYNSTTGIWSIPEVVCGTSQTLEVTVTVNGNGTNTASVQSQNQPDPVSSNNSASENVATGSTGGNNGGIESEGSMASLIAQRNFERIKTGAHTFYDRINEQPTLSTYRAQSMEKTNGLNAYLPVTGPQNAPAVVTSPTDLIGITNALDIFAVDYLNTANNRLASILAIETQNEVYNHTKVICDRLNGAELNDIKRVNIDGHTFIMARLDQENGLVDMAITFVAYKKADGSFTIDARWNQNEYEIQNSDKVYNFQVWSVSESLTKDLVSDILSLMQVDGQVNSITSSNVSVPTVYVKTGRYENGALQLEMVNTIGASEINIMANRTLFENGTRTNFGNQIALNATKSEETVTWNTGYIFDSGFEILNNVGGGRDILYMADGPWGADFERNTGVSNSAFSVSQETGFTSQNGEMHLERDIQFTGSLKNYVSIYRMIRPGHRSADLSDYNQITFDASLSGFNEIIVTLVSEEITKWSEQYRITVPVNNAAMGSYTIDIADLVSAGNLPLDLSKIMNITFSVVGDYQNFAPISLDIANVTFTNRGKAIGTAELDYDQKQSMNVYPNPFSGAAHIDLNLVESGEVSLELYDLSGKMVDRAELGYQFSGVQTAVYTPNVDLFEGVYLMKVHTAKQSFTQKVVYRK